MSGEMLVMKSRERQIKEQIRKECEKYQRQEFMRLIEEMDEELRIESKYNAILHVLYFLIVLHDVEGMGAKRLSRFFDDFAHCSAEFRTKLEDGIAWTYVRKRLYEIGIEISDIDFDKAERVFQKKYEKGVRRNGEF